MKFDVGIRMLLVLAFMTLIGCDPEQRAWETAQRERTPEAIRTFLTEYREGPYAQDAMVLLNEVLAEEGAWEAASSAGDDRILRRFLQRYPGSPHVAEATAALAHAEAALPANFTADALLVFLRPEQGGYIVASALQNGPYPMTLWFGGRGGGLAFSLNGSVTNLAFEPPDPATRNVAIVVLDNTGLIPELETGNIYIWRGGDALFLLRGIGDASFNEIADAFGFDPMAGYVGFPPAQFRGR